MNRVCCLGMTLGAVLLKPALPAYAADGGFPSRVRYDQLRAEFGSPSNERIMSTLARRSPKASRARIFVVQ